MFKPEMQYLKRKGEKVRYCNVSDSKGPVDYQELINTLILGYDSMLNNPKTIFMHNQRNIQRDRREAEMNTSANKARRHPAGVDEIISGLADFPKEGRRERRFPPAASD
ncbi:hypothetical protein EVAR_43119_1 [Eumeta japonica]|uniref:Uncharacterized protein n=1 Tax=Eumeta variegata TaxID=151549 RepID=A0A4C1XPS7_EUMVA|nr:hypothetical protein EVAR_43119_1 [Eumeta japonica]